MNVVIKPARDDTVLSPYFLSHSALVTKLGIESITMRPTSPVLATSSTA
jgi:hypothetical protein